MNKLLANYIIKNLKTPRCIHLFQIITGFAAVAALGISLSAYFLSFKPSLNITNSYFVKLDAGEDITMNTLYQLQNFGRTTAYDVKKLNHRILIVRILDNELKSLEAYRQFGNESELRKKRALMDIRGRARSAIIDGLIDCFKKDPLANKEKVENLFSKKNFRLFKGLFKKKGLDISKYIFSLAECNNDMDIYFSGSSTYPPSPKPTLISIAQEMGGALNDVLNGDAILIVYSIILSRGEVPFSKYYSSYIGFYDRTISGPQFADRRYPMNRYSIW